MLSPFVCMYATFWDAGVDIGEAHVMSHTFLGQNNVSGARKRFYMHT